MNLFYPADKQASRRSEFMDFCAYLFKSAGTEGLSYKYLNLFYPADKQDFRRSEFMDFSAYLFKSAGTEFAYAVSI